MDNRLLKFKIYMIVVILLVSIFVFYNLQIKKYPYYENSVIAIDINKNNIIDKIAHIDTKAWFDFNGNDIANNTEWIDRDYILAYDANHDGKITFGKEFFYDEKESKIDVLKKLDNNKDGLINFKDSEYEYLRIFSDKNKNGSIDKDEILYFNLLEINIDKQLIQIHEDKYKFEDTPLVASTKFTKYANNPIITLEILRLPFLRGYGTIFDSNIKYMMDQDFLNYTKILSTKKPLEIEQEFYIFFKKWTGLEDIHNKYGIKREIFNTDDKVWIMESMVGANEFKDSIEKSFSQNLYSNNPYNVQYIDKHFEATINSYEAKFLIQTIYKDIIQGAFYSVAKDKMDVIDNQMVEKSILDYLKNLTHKIEIKRFAKTLVYLNIEEKLFQETLINKIENQEIKSIFMNEYNYYRNKR